MSPATLPFVHVSLFERFCRHATVLTDAPVAGTNDHPVLAVKFRRFMIKSGYNPPLKNAGNLLT